MTTDKTLTPEILAALRAPFAASDLEVKPGATSQKTGKALALSGDYR